DQRLQRFDIRGPHRGESVQKIAQLPALEAHEASFSVDWFQDAFGSVLEDHTCAINPIAFLYVGEMSDDLVRRPCARPFVMRGPVVVEAREHRPEHIRSLPKHLLAELE